VPGLGTAKIHKLHEALGVDSIESLEQAVRDGRVARLPRYGPKTAEKILRGIERLRAAGTQRLFPQGAEEGARVLATVRAHPDVLEAEVAGSIRRRRETVGDVDIVAACGTSPARVATSFANAPGVRSARSKGVGSVAITYVDGTCFDLHCVALEDFPIALWRATGSSEHLDAVAARLAERGFALQDDRLLDERHAVVPIADEGALYRHAGLAFVPPELREGRGEIEIAATGSVPALLEAGDIRGVLHCHSTWSDGKATIAQMADAARRARLELHRDHRPLASRVLRQRPLARARARAARRDRRTERLAQRRACAEGRGRPTSSPTAHSITATICSTGSTM
jgi:DNA polymerase (family 10)